MSFRVEPALPGHPRCYRGVCGACGRSAPGERAVNTGIEVDHQDGIYQVLFLCESCVAEWARALGLASKNEVEGLREEAVKYAVEAKELRLQIEHYSHLEALILDAEAARHRREVAPEPDVALVIEPDLPEGMVPYVPRVKARR